MLIIFLFLIVTALSNKTLYSFLVTLSYVLHKLAKFLSVSSSGSVCSFYAIEMISKKSLSLYLSFIHIQVNQESILNIILLFPFKVAVTCVC